MRICLDSELVDSETGESWDEDLVVSATAH